MEDKGGRGDRWSPAGILNLCGFNILGGGGGGKAVISSNVSSEFSECPVRKVLLSAVMLNMLNHVESPSPPNISFSCHVEYVECFGNYQGLFSGGGG